MRPLRIVVIGLGYVGLTLALSLTKKNREVIGIEIDLAKAESLKAGITEVNDLGIQKLLDFALSQELLKINGDVLPFSGQTIFIVTVGTPVVDSRINFAQLDGVSQYLHSTLKDEDLVIMRSTMKIGESRVFYNSLLKNSGKKIRLGVCPERTIEGRAIVEINSLPQIISGIDAKSLAEVKDFFESLNIETVSSESIEAAEFIKLISNAYRDLNFAFGNEIADISESWNIDCREAIEVANYKYERSNIQRPGLTGGPCLEKDSIILDISARSVGKNAAISVIARELNLDVPRKAINRIAKVINPSKIGSPKFLIIGLAFKGIPETSDLRGSLAPKLINEIYDAYPQCQIYTWDPIVKNYIYAGTEKVINLPEILPIIDVVIIQNNNLTNFEEFKKDARLHLNSKAIIYDFWDMVKPKMFSSTIQILTLGKGN